ncbi:hypothetical protein [Bacillus salipaludis]|uniref:hypothetical protein n=1 Tax=Bacillus salipaludis TaxID=2547811 RepID=UPI002E1A6E80|nr:hypothetical protein [Bacillus salipaludis]
MITFSIFLLSGCGSEDTANKVVDALKNEDYDEAQQIFENAINDSENKGEINDTTSKAIQEYLDEAYNNVSFNFDGTVDKSFSNLLKNVRKYWSV